MSIKVPVKDEDILQFSDFYLIIHSILGAFSGYLGGVFLFFGIVLALPTIPVVDAILLTFLSIPTSAFFVLGLVRNKVVKQLAGRGFAFLYVFQRVMAWLAVIGTGFAVIGLSVSRNFPASALIISGLFFWLSIPRYYFSRVVKTWNEGRLCLLQFLAKKGPENSSYSWLGSGFRKVEKKLQGFGLATRAGSLFLGESYSLFTESASDSDLETLGNWLVNARSGNVSPILSKLLSQSKQAKDEGFRVTPRLSDYLANIPWQKMNYAITAIAGIIGIILLVLGYLRTL